jgi:hypothetical protein
MTSVGKPLGRITLRDFKAVFDRPGFYRYHIKNTDTEYGMVKEEVSWKIQHKMPVFLEHQLQCRPTDYGLS